MVDVGLYQVGTQVAALPVTEIAAPVRGPLYSTFSKVYHDIDQLRRTFLDSLAIQTLIIVPLTVGVAVTAPEATAIFLGSKWMAVTPLVPIIPFYQLFDAMGHYMHTVMIALNRQRLYTITYYISIALRVPLTIWWALEGGLRGAAFAMLATAAVNAVLWSAQLGPLLQLRWRRALLRLWRPVLAAVMMGGVVLIVSQWLPTVSRYLHILPRLVIKVATGSITYAVLLGLFWLMAGAPGESPEVQILRTIRAALERIVTIPQFGTIPSARRSSE